MKRAVFFIVFLLIGAACNEKVIEKPENLIPRDKMIDIYFDLSLINAGKAIDPVALKNSQIEPMSYIFKKYAIDSAQFVSSDLYYAAIPLEYEAIYRTLETRLEEHSARIIEERERKSDSARQRVINKTMLKDSIRK